MKGRKEASTLLAERLTRHTDRPVTPQARRLHLQAIDSALHQGPAAAPVRSTRRRTAVLALAAALAVVPAGTAIAAEGSVPGDLLYPVKKATEAVRSVLDTDVVADHRVDELAKLIERDAPATAIDESLGDALREVDRLPADHRLHDRLDEITAGMVTDRASPPKEPVTDQAPAGDQIPADDRPDSPATDHRQPRTDTPPANSDARPGHEPVTDERAGSEPVDETPPTDEPPHDSVPPEPAPDRVPPSDDPAASDRPPADDRPSHD